MTEYVSIKLPKAFVEFIAHETKEFHWESRADMVKYALRKLGEESRKIENAAAAKRRNVNNGSKSD